ncbi:MAG: DEAD/DEAH box helicase, partial [Actinomycetota bacterium]
LWERIRRKEEELGLDLTRGPESGFTPRAYDWCRGEALENLIDEEFPAGDFIRACKQVLDLLNQLKAATADPALQAALEEAYRGINRGVVAYAGLI